MPTKKSKKMKEATNSILPAAKTIGDLIEEIAPKTWKNRRCLMWPPDAFVVCGAILQRSGAYTEILKDWPPKSISLDKRARRMKNIGQIWAEQAATFHELGDEESFPPVVFFNTSVMTGKEFKDWENDLLTWADSIDSYAAVPLDEVYKYPALIEALMNICASADEACIGVGQPDEDTTALQTQIGLLMSRQLNESSIAVSADDNACKQPATMCKYIHPSRAIALPKLHTPQSGMTLRSLSHHISFCLANEVCPEWYSQYFNHLDHSINVLIVPWPDKVEPADFHACNIKSIGLTLPPRFGHFIYRPRKTAKDIRKVLRRACEISGRIDAVFFPEGAFGSQSEFDQLVDSLLKERSDLDGETPAPFLVIGGVLKEKSNGVFLNQACCKTAIWDHSTNRWIKSNYVQHKHHAWKLNSSQIINYGISSRLDPTRDWWEHISLRERDSLFMALNSWLTLCVVICEDLARPDPLTELVRAVGPNLVLALLMDGPQLPQRWSGRYATVLADDPGSAVLSITSLGMAESCMPNGKARSRTIGLWKDTYDSAQTIDLEPGAEAVVLTLAREHKEEWSADGRSDGNTSAHLRLGGVLQVFAE